MTALMDIAAEFVNAETEDDQAAVIERHSVGLIRHGLRDWALKLERVAERSTGEEAATLRRAAEQAWELRESLTDLVRADEVVRVTPDAAWIDALNADDEAAA